MPADYNVLQTIYEELRISEFAQQMAPRLLDFAQRNDWLGRQILDLGSGTGVGMDWMAQHGYLMTGVDQSAAMLAVARQRFANTTSVTILEQDIRQLEGIPNNIDLALAFDVMHEFDSIRDVERVFKRVYETLKPDKWLMFDLYTIQGLVARSQMGDSISYESDDLRIILANTFDYERQMQTRRYLIYRREGELWRYQEAVRTLRSYPIQGIVAILRRNGYSVEHVLHTDLTPYEPEKSGANRVIIVAQKS